MSLAPLLDKLNPEQQKAVSSEAKHLLVLAGAGTGKTRVLTHRIAWLLYTGLAQPENILAVTFTNKASREMRIRIEELLGHKPERLWVGTFHSIAHRLLRQHWKEAELPQNFQVMDSDDQLRLIKRLMVDYDLQDPSISPKDLQLFINGQKDEGLRAADIAAGYQIRQQKLLHLYQLYEQTCRRQGAVDFGELILRCTELIEQNEHLKVSYQQRFQFLLIDEFQDTNSIQYRWMKALHGSVGSLTVVGDDDQSIYGWRGAKVENIQRFPQEFTPTEIVRLEQNYRSTDTILSAANAVIQKNSTRLGKELWTDLGEGDRIQLFTAFNEQDEAAYVAERISDFISSGHNTSEIAILYRSNAQSRLLEEALIRKSIAYRIYGGMRFYERAEIKNALSYLKLMFNPQDDAAFERIINVPPRGIGAKSQELIRSCARDQQTSLWNALKYLLEQQMVSGRAATSLSQFIALIADMGAWIEEDELRLDKLMSRLLDVSGLLEFHRKEKDGKGENRVENLEELKLAADNFCRELDQDLPIADFLAQASLDAGDHEAADHEHAVSLMTLHSAKGLEFPIVFLVGVEEQLFPHKMSIDSQSGLEEERRLAYVGITRAMRQLIVSHAETRRLWGSENRNRRSRFIDEIPSELINEVRPHLKVSNPMFSKQTPSNTKSQWHEDNGITIGARVRHAMFGEGVVLNTEGQGEHIRIQIVFEQAGIKWLMKQFAKLEWLD